MARQEELEQETKGEADRILLSPHKDWKLFTADTHADQTRPSLRGTGQAWRDHILFGGSRLWEWIDGNSERLFAKGAATKAKSRNLGWSRLRNFASRDSNFQHPALPQPWSLSSYALCVKARHAAQQPAPRAVFRRPSCLGTPLGPYRSSSGRCQTAPALALARSTKHNLNDVDRATLRDPAQGRSAPANLDSG